MSSKTLPEQVHKLGPACISGHALDFDCYTPLQIVRSTTPEESKVPSDAIDASL